MENKPQIIKKSFFVIRLMIWLVHMIEMRIKQVKEGVSIFHANNEY